MAIPPVPREYYISVGDEKDIMLKLYALTCMDKLKWAFTDQNDSDVYETRLGEVTFQLICSRKGDRFDPSITMYSKDAAVRLDPFGDDSKSIQIYNYLRSDKLRTLVTDVTAQLTLTSIEQEVK